MATATKRKATRDYHPAERSRAGNHQLGSKGARGVSIPRDVNDVEIEVGGHTVRLTNLQKAFWPEEGITKGDLLRYYVAVAPVLLPHLLDRAMVMKRYPNGLAGEFFFMKRAPTPRPEWIDTCSIEHKSSNVIEFPIVRDLASL